MAERLDPLVVTDEGSPRPMHRNRRGTITQEDQASSKRNQRISQAPVVLDDEDGHPPQPTHRSRPVAPAHKDEEPVSRRSKTQALDEHDNEDEDRPRTTRRTRQAPVRFGNFVQVFPSEVDNIEEEARDPDEPPAKRRATDSNKGPSSTVLAAEDDAFTDEDDSIVHDPDYGHPSSITREPP